jgi:ankyrin repeat protein
LTSWVRANRAAIALVCAVAAGCTAIRGNPRDYFDQAQQIQLLEAIAEGDVAAQTALIRDGADASAVGKEGVTPLFWALAHRELESFELLLSNGARADVALLVIAGRTRLISVLEITATAEDGAYLRAALDHGADPDFTFGYEELTSIIGTSLDAPRSCPPLI